MVMAPSAIGETPEYKNGNLNRLVCEGKDIRPLEGQFPVTEDGQAKAKRLIHRTLHNHIRSVDQDTCVAGEEDTFYVADLGEVYRQHRRWKLNLGRVKPHYAVKCNPDVNVLKLLAGLGTGFDCASKAEIETVLALGVDASRIIYAQPCKNKSYIRYAAQVGVKQMTFDNGDELYKIKQFCPDAQLYLRILTDDSASTCRLSLKFGATVDSTKALLEQAQQLGLDVVGVAFHIGSGATDPDAFTQAVKDARYVFNEAKNYGFELKNLDVGGGFMGETFEEMAHVLSRALDEHIPSHVRIIAEPGRYYVSSAFTIASNVIARRTIESDRSSEKGEKSYMLYLNDGVYGNFSSIMYDHQQPVPHILRCGDPGKARGNIHYSLWGPTCDGIDCILQSAFFNDVLDVGDWLYFENMGAYTKCSATRFNGFSNDHQIHYIISEEGARALLEAS